MKKRVTLFSNLTFPVILLTCLLACCLVLSGCGGSGSNDLPETNPAENFIGTWELETMTDGDDYYDADDIELLKEYDMAVYLILDENGEMTFEVFGEIYEGEWEVVDASTCTVTIDDSSVEATLQDDILTLAQEDTSMDFIKIDPEDKIDTTTSNNSSNNNTYVSDYDENNVADDPSWACTLVDDDLVTIEVVSAHTDEWGDSGLNIRATNNSGDPIQLTYVTSSWSIDGIQADPVFWIDLDPGASAEDFMWWDHDESFCYSLDDFVHVSGSFEVLDENYNTIATYAVSFN